MPRFRLKFHSTEIDLPPGEVVIGRALECFIRLDDAMVSRRHARLEVGRNEVVLADLGSRNGVTVNGQKVKGSFALKVGDKIGIGHEEFTVLAPGAAAPGASSTSTGNLELNLCPGCGHAIPAGVNPCPRCGRPLTGARPTTITDVKATSSQGAIAVLTAVGDKALALGRVEEAERILGGSLRDIQARIARGHRPDASQMDPAIQRALRLARETGKEQWFRWVFEVGAALGMVLTSQTIDELHLLMFQHRPDIAAAVDAYCAKVTAPPRDDDAQFQLKRVAALRRLCKE
jgi:hypothetical protein